MQHRLNCGETNNIAKAFTHSLPPIFCLIENYINFISIESVGAALHENPNRITDTKGEAEREIERAKGKKIELNSCSSQFAGARVKSISIHTVWMACHGMAFESDTNQTKHPRKP